MNNNEKDNKRKLARNVLLFVISFFSTCFCLYGFDIDGDVSKDENFRNLCKRIDDSLIENDYLTTRRLLDEMELYEPCLSFYEKRFQFATDIFLCIKEDNYENAITKFDRFFRENIGELERRGGTEIFGFYYLGFWLYSVERKHKEIANYLGDHILSYYGKWVDEQEEDYKLEADDSLSYKYLSLELAFIFYLSEGDNQNAKKAFDLIQKLLSFIDLHSYVSKDSETLYSTFNYYIQLNHSIVNKTLLLLKPIKPDDLPGKKPFKKNGNVVIPLITDFVVEGGCLNDEGLESKTIRFGQTYKREWGGE